MIVRYDLPTGMIWVTTFYSNENLLQGTHKTRPRYTMARQAVGDITPGDLSVETWQDLHQATVHAKTFKTFGDQYGHINCRAS